MSYFLGMVVITYRYEDVLILVQCQCSCQPWQQQTAGFNMKL